MSVRSVLCGCLCVVLSAAVHADETSLKYLVEVKVERLDQAAELAAAGFDVAGVNRKTSMVGVVVTPDELLELEARGFPVTVRQSNAPGQAVDALLDYTDPQELSAFMDAVVAAHHDLAKKLTLKDTLFEGQKQYALQITKDVGVANDRPSFILDAQHHAREVMTPEIAKDMIDYLTSRYATDAAVQRWVDNINIWIVPSVNPDGGMYVFSSDDLWRKNRHPSCPVDNNRNYPSGWNACNGSSGVCSNDTYRGTAGGSEPETQGLMQLTSDKHPFFTLSYHTYGEYLMYPYGCSDPDERQALDEVAQGLNAILENDAGVTGQYATGPVWSTIYLADGASIDTQYGLYGAYAYVIEANASGFSPDYATWRDVTVQRQRTAWSYFLDKTLDGTQIRGKVTDFLTGAPLAATLNLQEVTFTHGEAPRKADAAGNYHLLVHSNGTYHVSYSAPGHCTATQAIASGLTDRVDVVLGQPDVPAGVSAVPAGDYAIDVSWQPAVNADQYRILRSLNPGGPYTLAGTVPASQTTFHDTLISGVATYYYVVRSVQGCDSGNSAEASAATTGNCFVGPAFAGVATATNAASSTCTMNLSWPAAATRCGGSVTYRVYRNTIAPFAPSPSNLIVAGLTGTSYADRGGLAYPGSYAYIVRAVDIGNGADDGNFSAITGQPTGPIAVGTWSDNAGDTGPPQLLSASPWGVRPTGGKTAPKVYSTGTYANNVCAALTSPPIGLSTGSTLAFASKYDMEADFDLGIVEVATGPSFGAWTKVAVNYPDDLPNGGNACGIPTSGANTVFSRTFATPVYPASPYTGSLAAYAGQTIKLRWRFSSDAGLTRAGWWVDDVAITNAQLPTTCAAGTPPNPKEPSADGGMKASPAPSGTAIQLTYLPGCGTLDHAVYWGAGPIAGSLVWTNAACGLGSSGLASFDPGTPPPIPLLFRDRRAEWDEGRELWHGYGRRASRSRRRRPLRPAEGPHGNLSLNHDQRAARSQARREGPHHPARSRTVHDRQGARQRPELPR